MSSLPSDRELASMRYEELVATLEELTRRMADGEVGIEEATDLYARAREVHRMAGERLDAVRRRIEELEEGEGPAAPGDRASVPSGG